MTNNPCSPEDSDAAGHAAFNDLTRRSFLRTTGLVAGGLFALRLSPDALANTNGLSSASSTTDPLGQLYRKLFPADKHLDPIWVKSLTERGVPVRYLKSRNELQYIGMPVGGLMCGTVYLGGDGRLWVWEILNRQHIGVEPNTAINPYNNQPTDPGSGSTYVKPLNQQSSFAQGFALRLQRPGQTPEVRSLDTQGFTEIGFEGSYPLAQVSYSDKDIPVSVTLTSYAPFIPLNEEDYSLPVTILEYEIQNNSNATVKGDIFGWSDNPVGTDSIPSGMTAPTDTRFLRNSTFSGLQYRALPAVDIQRNPTREDIVFADFEQPTYGAWKTEGTAFGTGPARAGVTMPGQQPISGYQGSGFVNSFTQQGDLSTGKLISPDFIIERDYIHFLIGGGNWRGQTCMNLIINGKIIFSKTGIDQEQLYLPPSMFGNSPERQPTLKS